MSVDRELEFIEPEEGRWFYVLEDWSAPRNAWDWHEHVSCYGPFESHEAACYHQYNISRISTGGSTITDHSSFEMTPLLGQLIESATLDTAH